ncbi:MAG: 3-methyl-2-oxobutanoate hydroxymethyltransferase [Helicobacter sp.]|nr:3-methyl-2-oxobutanoate hydroxymethyltransferase [Helicobacter sp.]MDY5741362.1 3-methyl-2-oxobutanoate hydroxymethyltransferase [Helicobacter sp.]
MQKITLDYLKQKKGKEKITAITAYDGLMAGIFDDFIEIILVGDSLNMSFHTKPDTLSASVDTMIYHTKAVCSNVKKAFVIADMPFGSYYDKKSAIKNALRFYNQTECNAIKLEVNEDKLPIIEALCKEGFAIMAHIGLKPQFVRTDGGYKVKGKTPQEQKHLVTLAKNLESAGVFGFLLEGIKAKLGEEITKSVEIPTIGIGAGGKCDGQILVWSDAFGFFDGFKPKFVRTYLEGKKLLQDALRHYVDDVKEGKFPSEMESY